MNTIYDEDGDNLYIVIYKLGEGRHRIWFAIELIEFIKNIKKRKVDICYKAIKICENDNDGKTEATINEKLIFNKKKCDNVNYPINYFKIKKQLIIIYEVALGSLHSFAKYAKYDTKSYEKFILKIIPQMIDSINFVHKCKFIHTDIKPENFLLCGMTKLQNNIIEFTKKYNLETKFSSKIKKKDFDKIIDKPLKQFTEKIVNEFNLPNILNVDLFKLDYESDSESDSYSEYDSSDNDTLDSDDLELLDGENSDIISDLISNTDEISHISDSNDYFKVYDKFHTKYILDDLVENNNRTNENSDDNKTYENDDETYENEKKEEFEFMRTYMENPVVKLSDFEYLIDNDLKKKRTMQNRSYRCPEILLGLNYTEKSDYWAFGSTLYELILHKQLIDIKNENEYNIHDNDLLNLKLLIQKLGNFNEFINLIKSSPRKDYLLTNSNILKFVNKIEYNNWKSDIDLINPKIVNLIDINLNVDPNKRTLLFNHV